MTDQALADVTVHHWQTTVTGLVHDPLVGDAGGYATFSRRTPAVKFLRPEQLRAVSSTNPNTNTEHTSPPRIWLIYAESERVTDGARTRDLL